MNDESKIEMCTWNGTDIALRDTNIMAYCQKMFIKTSAYFYRILGSGMKNIVMSCDREIMLFFARSGGKQERERSK